MLARPPRFPTGPGGLTFRPMIFRTACAATWAAALTLLLWAAGSRAEIVALTAPNGREATAEYRPGRAELPAVMIVHGFLQTRDFPTVAGLANALAEAGHTVLTPTLTLNVSRRKRSLPCEAVHTHSLDTDVAEVAAWTRWLENRGHREMVLIGHSSGALAILPYLARPAPVVKGGILLSLVDRDRELPPAARAQLVRDLKARVARGDRSLVTTSYTFCRRYVSTPEALLSFVRIDRQTVLGWLGASRVPAWVVLGSADENLGEGWVEALRKQGTPVRLVEGANHFFNGVTEFELHDLVADILKSGRL